MLYVRGGQGRTLQPSEDLVGEVLPDESLEGRNAFVGAGEKGSAFEEIRLVGANSIQLLRVNGVERAWAILPDVEQDADATFLAIPPRFESESKLFDEAGCGTPAQGAEALPKDTNEDVVGTNGLVDDSLRASCARPDNALPIAGLDGDAEAGADGTVDLADDLEDGVPLALNIGWPGYEDG